jgi:hypothetical protein
MKKGLFIVIFMGFHFIMKSQCGQGQVSLTMVIHTDAWPYETYWQLVPEGAGCGNQVLAEGSNLNVGCASSASDNSPEGYAGDALVNVGPICLDSGSYDLIFIDTYGDGGLVFELYEDGVLMHSYAGSGFGNTFTFSTGVTLIPTYDSPCQAIPIVPNGPSVAVNNMNATGSLGEPTPNGNDCGALGSWCETGVSNSVWLTFIPTANESYEITSCHPETNTDTQMALWRTQDCQDFSSFQLISSNDDMLGGCNSGGDVYASQLFAGCLDTSYQYFLQIDGWNGSTGDIEVTVTSFNAPLVLDAWIKNITCPLNKGDVGDGMIQPYIIGSGIDILCEWTGPNGFASNDWIISGLAAGDYFLTAQTACGVSMNEVFTVSEPTWWNINPQPTYPSCSEEPDGGFAPVVTGGTPEYGFQWIGPNGFTSMDPILNNVGAGSYQLIITDANGCNYESQYTLQSSDEYSFDLGSELSLCLNQITTVEGPVGNNLIYYWQDGSDNAQFVIDPTQWGLGAHTLELSVVTTSGCFGSDQLNFVVNDCVNIEEVQLSDWMIYPNPSNEMAFQISKSTVGEVSCVVRDMTGRVISTQMLTSAKTWVELQNIESGVYQVGLLNKNSGTFVQKNWLFIDEN